MEFFEKIKRKLKIKNLLTAILFTLFAGVFIWLALSNGFSSEMQWQIGVRGSRSGIPIPNWLVSAFALVMMAIFGVSAFSFYRSFAKDTEYNNMIKSVEELGNPEYIGTMLSSMKKSKYAKGGDLRYNEKIIFYMKGTEVKVIAPYSVKAIRSEIEGGKSETHFVCVYHAGGVIKITVNKKTVLPLLDEMRATLSVAA